jgi:hypothetical protein
MISQRWEMLRGVLDERQRRLLAAAEAKVLGRGGVSAVAAATGISRTTIMAGLSEIEALQRQTDQTAKHAPAPGMRARQAGAGRKKIEVKDETLLPRLLALMNPASGVSPQSPLSWTCKSLRCLAGELKAQGHPVSHVVVGKLLKSQNYSLQSHARGIGDRQNPDRHAQFGRINDVVAAALKADTPVISVNLQKKALVDPDEAVQSQGPPHGQPAKVRVHDVVGQHLCHTSAPPIDGAGAFLASVDMDHDTSAFAVQAIGRWWSSTGGERYPQARKLLIVAEACDSLGHPWHALKLALSRLAQETGLDMEVHRLPPGTRKWHRIEHRMHSFMTMNGHERALIGDEVIISLIGCPQALSPLGVPAKHDSPDHARAAPARDQDFAAIQRERTSSVKRKITAPAPASIEQLIC